MPYDLSEYLVIGISSRALFDLQDEDEIFRTQGLEAYCRYQLEHEHDVLQPGTGFALVKGILRLNDLVGGKRKSEVILMSRNNADTSLRIFRSIEHYDLDISRAALTSGSPLAPYLDAFAVDLFLSNDESDVQSGINAGVASGLVYGMPQDINAPVDQIRIAFDGDAVLFSDESERIYQEQGLAAFLEHEKKNSQRPLPDGPFAKLFKTLAFLQSELGPEQSPIRTALVTARNSPAHERVILTLRAWGTRVDETFFLGGAPKDKILRAFRPHIFFDDQDVHLESAAEHVPVARVLHRQEVEQGETETAAFKPA